MNVIRLTSSTEFGSLEDLQPTKRMTVQDIRSLRRKAHAQTQITFSIARAIANAIAYIRRTANEVIAQRNINKIMSSRSVRLESKDRKFTAV